MNLRQKEKLESIINEGYIFHFSDYFTQGMNIFRKEMGSFIGYALMALGISFVLGLIPVLGNIANALITYPLMVGYALVAHKINRNEPFEFGDFFKGFDFFTPLVLQYLVLALASVALLVPVGLYAYLSLDIIGFEDLILDTDPSVLVIPILLMMVPMLYLYTSWRWAPYFIVFYKMPFWDAMETSRRLVGRQFWPLFAFMLLIGLLMVSGIIGFVVGIIFTIPLGMCVDYAAFADVTRLMEVEDSDLDITEHFVE